MRDTGRDRLAFARAQIAFGRGLRLHREVGAAVQHAQQSPRALRDLMVSSKTGRQCRLVERSGRSHDDERGRQFGPVAEWAVQKRPDVLRPPCC
jgi:hypothetical protein